MAILRATDPLHVPFHFVGCARGAPLWSDRALPLALKSCWLRVRYRGKFVHHL